MRFILPLAEQLDRAASELSVGGPLSSRLALILVDNAFELMCHQRCVELIEEDSRASKPALTLKEKAAGRGQAFDAKIALLKRADFLSELDARSLVILHSYRNQLYHVGLRDDPVIGPLADLYLKLTLEHAPRLLKPMRFLRWEEPLADGQIVAHFPELIAARKYSCKVDIAAFCGRIAARAKPNWPVMRDALADHLIALANRSEANFSIIAKGRSGKDDPMVTLRRVQQEADTIAEILRRHRERERQLKANRIPFEPFDPDQLSIARGSHVLMEANQKLLPKWKPRHPKLPFPSWRRQAEKLRQGTDDLAVLDQYDRLHRQIDDLDEIMAEPIQDMHGWHQYQEDMMMDHR
ncbi:hypothetical protein [Paracoccus yeei]|uniref:Uncharacterized protein n=1 Tax=Paracoccus yeei TaxID=147645 RepID=A0A2D2C3C9_9RHOB|nr:hypothetical protein [Paracoccus yeei]ATQ57008.1 hypothetical protein PYTT13_15190 [Paracoccus yeei]